MMCFPSCSLITALQRIFAEGKYELDRLQISTVDFFYPSLYRYFIFLEKKTHQFSSGNSSKLGTPQTPRNTLVLSGLEWVLPS